MGSTWKAIELYLLAIQEEYCDINQDFVMSSQDDPMYNESECEPDGLEVLCSDPLHYPSATPVNFGDTPDAMETSVTPPNNGVSTLLNLDLDTNRSKSPDQETSFYSNDPFLVGRKCYDQNRNITTAGNNQVQCAETHINIKQETYEHASLSAMLEQCPSGSLHCEPVVPDGKQLEACIQTLLNSNIDLQAINIQDVQYTSRHLGIPEDPLRWTHEDVFEWVSLQCRQFQVPPPNMDYCYVTGPQLCSMSETEFKDFAPGAGETLYSLLFIWRNVVEQTLKESKLCENYLPTLSQIPVPTSPTIPSTGRMVSCPDDWDQHLHQEQLAQRLKNSVSDDDTLPEEPVNHHRQTIQLWQFLRLLLVDPSGRFRDCIKWVDRAKGIFKIENSSRVAKLWGKRKNRPAMNYDKLSRSIRQYYKKGIIKKTEQSKRLVYQFCNP